MNAILRIVAGPVRRVLRSWGFDVTRYPSTEDLPADLPKQFQKIVTVARPLTLTTMHRLASMLDAVRYVVANEIPGSKVECGVWRGGNMVVAARTLRETGEINRDLYLYDTFEGMTPPTQHDKDYQGAPAESLLAQQAMGTGVWCAAGIDDVRANMEATGYPMERVHLVKGPVEISIPGMRPEKIALLRLDTDWYQSTKHELVHLYPRLVPGGVLIVDDYGHWQGARQAVDEYMAEHQIKALLVRVDYTCRVMIRNA